jgi:hypothetical protein
MSYIHRINVSIHPKMVENSLLGAHVFIYSFYNFQTSWCQAAFRKLYVRYNDLVCQYNLSLGQMLSSVFRTIVKPFLIHWSWLLFKLFTWTGIKANGGCDQSTGDTYSSWAPDPTSDIFRDPCTPILGFVFPIWLMRYNTVHYLCHFIKCIRGIFKSWIKNIKPKYILYIPSAFLN